MKDNYNGLSKFQNEKRIKKQRQKERDIEVSEIENNILIKQSKRVIAIMLDIEGTINGIDNNKTKEFIKLLEKIKKQYNAVKVKICISTHDFTEDRLIALTQIIKPHLTSGIILDKSFYLDGMYDPKTEKIEILEHHYNYQKIDVFERQYLFDVFSNEQVVWFGIIDDNTDESKLQKFKYSYPFAVFRPSQIVPCENNAMFYTTGTYGFDGVLELLRNYTTILSKVGTTKLFEQQKNSLVPLNYYIFANCLKYKDYSLILRYLTESTLDINWYILLRNFLETVPYENDSEELSTIRNLVLQKLFDDKSYSKTIKNRVEKIN